MRKNIFASIMLAFALLFATPADAQVKLGIKAGLDINSFSLKGFDGVMDNFSSSNRAGFFVGPTVDITIPLLGFGVDISALYEHKTIDYSYNYVNENNEVITDASNEKMQFISVPLNIKYSFGIGSKASVYAATGPQVAFNISGKSLGQGLADARLKDADFSWNFGAGFTILKHYRLGYNFNLGITNHLGNLEVSGKSLNDVNKIIENAKGVGKSRTHQISFTYIF